MVKVKFYGILASKMPEKDDKGYWLIDGKGKTIGELIHLSRVKEMNVNYTIFVNNEREDITYILEEDDILTLLPLLAGG